MQVKGPTPELLFIPIHTHLIYHDSLSMYSLLFTFPSFANTSEDLACSN